MGIRKNIWALERVKDYNKEGAFWLIAIVSR